MLTMARVHTKGHPYRVSTETIYRCIYAQPVGERRTELIANLRQARNKRVPRSKGQDRRGHITDQLSIHFIETSRLHPFYRPSGWCKNHFQNKLPSIRRMTVPLEVKASGSLALP